MTYSNAWLNLETCILESNFALESGVISVDLEGSFNISNSNISENSAFSNPITKILISSTLSILKNVNLSDNLLVDEIFISKEKS